MLYSKKCFLNGNNKWQKIQFWKLKGNFLVNRIIIWWDWFKSRRGIRGRIRRQPLLTNSHRRWRGIPNGHQLISRGVVCQISRWIDWIHWNSTIQCANSPSLLPLSQPFAEKKAKLQNFQIQNPNLINSLTNPPKKKPPSKMLMAPRIKI